MKAYVIIFASIVAAVLLGFASIYEFEPSDPPVSRPLNIVAGLLILPAAPLGFLAEALVNRVQMPGPWSGLLMLASVFISAAVWSFSIYLVSWFWKRKCTEPVAGGNAG